MSKLKDEVRSYLKTLPRSHFFKPINSNSALMGSMRGRFTYFLILESDRNLSYDELKFSEKIRRCGGEHYVIRSIHDLQELAKIRGWL